MWGLRSRARCLGARLFLFNLAAWPSWESRGWRRLDHHPPARPTDRRRRYWFFRSAFGDVTRVNAKRWRHTSGAAWRTWGLVPSRCVWCHKWGGRPLAPKCSGRIRPRRVGNPRARRRSSSRGCIRAAHTFSSQLGRTVDAQAEYWWEGCFWVELEVASIQWQVESRNFRIHTCVCLFKIFIPLQI
jgi:hypothetical protein